MDAILCLDAEINLWGIFDTTIAPALLYYSYIPIILISLFSAIFLFINRDKSFSLPTKLFSLLCIVFSLYIINDIFQWLLVPAHLVHFSWEMIVLIKYFILFLTIYLVFTFLKKQDLSLKYLVLLTIPLLPILLFLPTPLNMQSLSLQDCGSNIGPLYYYLYVLETLTIVTIIILTINHLKKKADAAEKKIAVLFSTGSCLFLLFLSASDMIGEFTGEFTYLLIGPIGMAFFLVLIAYVIVKYRAFNINLATAQALVVGLITLIGSQFFFVETITNTILVGVTLILSSFGGYQLVKSVKQEVKQKEDLAEYARKLKQANIRLTQLDKLKSEFVSVASHQLRSPLTSIRGYAEMISDGSYGPVPQKLQQPLSRIQESSKLMAAAIEDFLNVSRIESGNMKYDLSDFNLKEEAERVADDLRPIATKKGLVLMFRSDVTNRGIVNADQGKVRQILHNLYNNALKYTEKGTITVFVYDKPTEKKIFVEVIDTGIGMSAETLSRLFGKFERARNAHKINANGTGLGLYIAKNMALKMGGDVTAASDGEGKGSHFILELPLQM